MSVECWTRIFLRIHVPAELRTRIFLRIHVPAELQAYIFLRIYVSAELRTHIFLRIHVPAELQCLVSFQIYEGSKSGTLKSVHFRQAVKSPPTIFPSISKAFVNLLRFDKGIVWIFVRDSPLLCLLDQQLQRGGIIN